MEGQPPQFCSRNFRAKRRSRFSGRILLVPEHPAVNEDALAAYRWLIDSGVAAGDIVIGGASASGGLTLMTFLALRAANKPLPAAAFMLSPWVDLTHLDGESYTSRAELDPVSTFRVTQIAAGTTLVLRLKSGRCCHHIKTLLCGNFLGIDKLERIKLLQSDPLVKEFGIEIKEPETISRFLGKFSLMTTQMIRNV